MQIQVNGAAKDVEDGTTVAALLEALDIRPDRVAVELNRELVPKARREDVVLREADRVELVTLVGGG